jgi:hypothetical protein
MDAGVVSIYEYLGRFTQREDGGGKFLRNMKQRNVLYGAETQ